MSLYQRYLSKSLIFIFSLFFLILFFLESSIGFKYFFNFTNYFFIGLKTEEISGNWRDFKLKKINFNIFGTSIKAESVHIITDPISLFKVSTILKKIKTKNLVISFNKKIKKVALKNNFLKEKKIKNTIFFKHSLILRKIYSDKILLKTQKKNIFLFGVFSGLQLSNDTCTFLPTKINSIYIDSSMRNVKNIDNKKSNFFIKKDIFYRNKIDNALSFFSIFKNFFIPININLINLKCNQLKFFNRTFLDIYKIKMSAQLKKNILKIKKIQIYSKYFKTKSKGKIFFRSDFSIFFIVKNEMSINIINNKAMNLLFKDTIDHKLNFKSNNLIKFNIHGEISLDDLNYPIHINLHLNRLFLPISKNLILSSKNFNFSLKGKINNYFLSLKNIINISGMPSFFISISAIGNIQNVVIKKIHFFPFFKEIKTKKFIKIKKEIDYNKYITQLAGKMRILSDFNKQSSNIFLPYFHVYGDFMRKKISVLGSLYYRKLNGITIPRINFLLGKNKGHISGSISKKVNLRSSIYANNLNYFSPNLKGIIKATLNIYSFCSLPSFSSVILGQKINWKNILYFNNIKITTNGNLKKSFPNKFFADFKNIRFSKFHINSLHIKSDWNNINQKFSLSLKDKKLSITFILNGHLNRKVGIWKGVLKKIDVKTSWGQWISRNNPLIFYHIKNSINFKNIKKIKNKNAFYSAINNIQTSLFKLIRQSPVKFQTDLFFNTQFQWKLRENITNLKLFLKGSNINLEKKIKEKIMFEKISAVNLYINFKKNNFITKWIIKKSKNSLKVNKISGFLNIYDFFHEKKIEGKVFLSDFSCSFLNFFENFFTKIQGKFSGNINFLGTIYQPQISADINFQDFYIKSDKIFKYMLLFFCSFPNKIENIKINQEIIMKKGNALFKLNSVVKNNISHIKWNILFHSNKLAIVLFPKIKLNFSSQLNLYYFLSKYDLIGYLKFSFFSFKINEKNFLF